MGIYSATDGAGPVSEDKQLDYEQKQDYENLAPDNLAVGGEVSEPEKDGITAKLEAFQDGMNNQGILQQLDSLKNVEMTGGTCFFTYDAGDFGEITFSFCEWEDEFVTFGNIMFMMVGFIWTIWFFMGRGDA